MSDLKVRLTINSAEIKELMGKFSSSAARAHDSALSRATKKVESELVDRTYEKINLKKGDIKDKLRVSGRMGEIQITPEPISLSRFLPSEPARTKKSKGVKVKLWRDREKVLFEGSFAGYGKNANFHIFKRVGKERLPIKKLHGKGVRDMWEVPKFSDGIIGIAQEEYATRFQSSFFAFIGKETTTTE